MAGSKRARQKADLLSRAAEDLEGRVRRGNRLIVGLSGGIDSVVLLDVLQRLFPQFQYALSALHLNHHLSPHAGAWAAFCERLCAARGVLLRISDLKLEARRGRGLEAAAREARYAVFREQPAEFIALAHHLDDQAETLMLQLLRGAGVRGLSAMPVSRVLDEKGVSGPRLLRPLLKVTRAEIEAYARACELEWITDESNASLEFDRNFVRAQVLPIIARRYPAYRETFARAARNFADAAELLDELANVDAEAALAPEGLRIDALKRLTASRARNLLRYAIAQAGYAMPNRKKLAEAVRQAMSARRDARVRVDLGSCELRVHRGFAHLLESRSPTSGWKLPWNWEDSIALPHGMGSLSFQRTVGAGISVARLSENIVIVRTRCGGERMQPHCARPRRTLKNLLQEAGVPPWQRSGLPLLFCGGQLVWAPQIGIDCAFQARNDEPGIAVSWHTRS